MPRRCCVASCSSTEMEGVFLHNFPNPMMNPERFKTWITNAGLVGESDEHVYKNRKICNIHFEDIYYYPSKRLNRLAIPTLHLPETATFDCNIDKNMDHLSNHYYTDINYLIPVMSRDIAVNDINIKVENDLSADQGIIQTEDRINYDMVNRQTMAPLIAIDEIKVEDDAVNQDITDQENVTAEHITISDMVCRSTTTEDVIHAIKAENEDHDVECGSTSTKDFVTDDIKVEVIQEIITPEEFTNIDTMCRSTLPTDVYVNSVKVEDCGVMNQNTASDSATDTDAKRGNVFLGEDYSTVDGLPSAETIHKVESSDTGVQQVTKVPDDSTRLAYNMKSPDHMRTHSGDKPFSCDICNKAFTAKYSLVIHIRQHTGEKPFSCDNCNKAFSSKSNLIIHNKKHTGEKPFSCDICNKAFSYKSSLVIHNRQHTGEKPFSCDVCHKTFSLKLYLTNHMWSHSGNKPFSCHICNKTFKLKRYLVYHTQLHSREKPFSCHICNKTFKLKRYLLYHTKLHSREKPFSCYICNKTFKSKRYLVLHIKRHSGGNPF